MSTIKTTNKTTNMTTAQFFEPSPADRVHLTNGVAAGFKPVTRNPVRIVGSALTYYNDGDLLITIEYDNGSIQDLVCLRKALSPEDFDALHESVRTVGESSTPCIPVVAYETGKNPARGFFCGLRPVVKTTVGQFA